MFIIDIPTWLSSTFIFTVTAFLATITLLIGSFLLYVIKEQLLR